MQIVQMADAQEFKNSQTCSVYEYFMEDRQINGAVVKLSGRYPETGCVLNLKCKELVYVIAGEGKVIVEGKETPLSEGDVVLISSNEKYFWDGNMTLFVSSFPAWTMEQYQKVP